jgi:DNA polymerase-3 subunit alpha
MEKFAAYGFNRSHSAAYSIVAYQTAYLKARYPAEYMSSVLTHNHSNIEKITFFMDECKRQHIKVLGPHINESGLDFDVNQEGQIRFGLGAIKGTGEAAVDAIISERAASGLFKDIFDFAQRVNLRTVNKKTFESLAMAGAFDCFEDYHRRQYLVAENGDSSLIEKLIRFGNRVQDEQKASQVSLFGGDSGVDIPLPKVPYNEPYTELEKLRIEKEVVGFYISGHPLDQFKLDIKHFCTCTVNNDEKYRGEKISVAGIVTKFNERVSKNGRPFGLFSIEDFEDSLDLAMFGEEYLKFRHLLSIGNFVFIEGQVIERYKQPGVWELRPYNIQLLSEIRDKKSKGIQIQVDLHHLTNELIEKLENLSQEYPGPCQLKLNIADYQENIEVETLSRKFQVKPQDELIAALEGLSDISYRILN